MLNDRFLICKKKTCSTCILHFGTSAKQQCEINSKFYGEGRHECVLSFLYFILSTGVIDSLKFTFPGGIFVGVSDKIQCLFFFGGGGRGGPEKRQRLISPYSAF